MRIDDVYILMKDGVFRRGSVDFNEKIKNIELHEAGTKNADYYLIPGLIDIHTHGAVNGDHSDGSDEMMLAMGEFYAKNGVTSFLATTMTYDEKKLSEAMRIIAEYKRPEKGAKCIGINMEGPFLSYEKRGAHLPEALTNPDIAMFERLYNISKKSIRLVSIAPELPGSIDFISEISKKCKVSLAHSAANYDIATAAFSNGATHVTHLFNAMNPFLHRDPGIIGAAKDAGAYVEIICDGIHSHPAVIRAVYYLFKDRICMISDSIRSAGLPDGEYESGGMPITVKDGKAILSDGTIAGSNISLMQGVRCAVNFGIPLAKAVMAATVNNARAIGMDDEIGSLKPGAAADMVVLDNQLSVKKVFINGKALNI